LTATLDLLRMLADAMPGLVSYIDAEGRYRYVNGCYRDWFGIDPAAWIGKTPLDVAGPEGFAALAPHLRRALAGETVDYETIVAFRHGGTRAVRGHFVPDRAADGTVQGVFSFTADVTGEHATEDALRRAHQDALDAVRAKSQFIAAASHDLRQPLHAMALFIGALGRRVSDPEAIEIVGHLRTAVDSMRGMFSALLDISKLDAGALIPAPEDFPVAGLFGRMEAGFQAQAAEKRLAFRVVPCSATIRTDPALLETMLRHLVHNAIKFTAEGKVLLGCRRRGRALRLDVLDMAGGIEPDRIATIFDEFSRYARGGKTGTEGLGLGLAIVRRLSRLLDLPVTVHSVPGRGSRFSIAVPLAASAARPAMPAAPGDERLEGLRILAVDDDDMVRGAVVRALRDWGCEVAAAGSPAEALAALERGGFRPDMLLIDYNLGTRVNGLDLINLIAERLPHRPPAIVVTGSTETDAILRFEASGYAWLSKPVDSAELRRTVAALSARARGGA
jgi:PAS domain S-box-containing protein